MAARPTGRAAASAPARTSTRTESALERALDVLLALGIVWIVARLARQAMDGTLASDECFHAYAAEWIAKHRAIPEIWPELYSGFFDFYPPLFHVLGAAWLTVFGAGALLAMPVALHAALLAFLAFGACGTMPKRAGLRAAALLAAHPGLHGMAGRFYVEPLVTLLFAAGAALLLVARTRGAWAWTVLLGLVTGLALLAKFNAWTLWIGVVAVAAWDGAQGRRASALRLGSAAALALAMVLPWLVRNQQLYGSPWYPAFMKGLDPLLWRISAHRFSTPPAEFLAALPAATGNALLAMAAAALGGAALRREWTLREGLLLGAIAAMIATAFAPFAQARHLNPLVAVLAMTSSAGLSLALRDEPRVRLAVSAVVAGVLAFAVFALPNPRRDADPPDFLRAALPHVREHTPPGARILSLWTYDTWYVARRPATWPIPWGQQRPPIEPFYDREPDSLAAHLRAHGITHVLSPARVTAGRFDGANYPESFTRGIAELLRARKLRLEWQSSDLILLSVVSPPDSSAPARR